MTELASFYVLGRPRTKGSLKVITPRGRKPILVEDHVLSAPWRKQIVREINARLGRPIDPYPGAVSVHAVFRFDRVGPSAARLPWPTLNAGVNANGDLDKLLRNLLDALQGAGLIKDDCQVVSLSSSKRWASEDLPAGVNVTVYRMEDS